MVLYPEGDPRREELSLCELENARFTLRGGFLGGFVVILTPGWSVVPNQYLTEDAEFTLESVPGTQTRCVTIEYLCRECPRTFTFTVIPRPLPQTLSAVLGTRKTYTNKDPAFLSVRAGFNVLTITGAGGAGEDAAAINPGGGGGETRKYIFYAHERFHSVISAGTPVDVGSVKNGISDSYMLIHAKILNAEGGSPAVGAVGGLGGGVHFTPGGGGNGGTGIDTDTCGGGAAGGVFGFGGDGSGFSIGTEDGGDGGLINSVCGAGYGFIVRPQYLNFGLVPFIGESSSVDSDVVPIEAFPGNYGGGGNGKSLYFTQASIGAPGAVHVTSEQ